MNTAIQINIKKQLTAKNMTAAELERRTGIPHAVVNILHGRSKNPSLKTAQAIAKELGCSLEELFAEEAPVIITNKNKTWDAQLYVTVVNSILDGIKTLNLQPQPEDVATWITEVYRYTLGSPELKVDQRFVQWLLER